VNGTTNVTKYDINIKPKFKIEIKPKVHIDVNIPRLYKGKDKKYQVMILNLVVNEYYYFNPKFYNWDTHYRILFTLDGLVKLYLNFDFTLINEAYLYYIMSIAQLYQIKLIDKELFEFILEILIEQLNLKIVHSFRYKKVMLSRFRYGVEVERLEIVLTDVNNEFTKQFSRNHAFWRVKSSNSFSRASPEKSNKK